MLKKKPVDAQFTSGLDVVVADKTGNVYRINWKPSSAASPGSPRLLEPKFLLGHCSTITGLQLLDIGKTTQHTVVATSDVEGKIRVSKFPECYEIISFCFGHTSFIASLGYTYFHNSDGSRHPLLVSTSADGTVRLWEPKTGKNLDVFRPGSTPDVKSTSSTAASSAAGGAPDACSGTASSTVGRKRRREDAPDGFDTQDGKRKRVIGSLTTSAVHNLVAVGLVGEAYIDILTVSDGGAFRPLDEHRIQLPLTQVHLAFDPKGRLWVAMLGDDGVDVMVLGLNKEGTRMIPLQMSDLLTKSLFKGKIDPTAQNAVSSLVKTYSNVGQRSRKTKQTKTGRADDAKKSADDQGAAADASTDRADAFAENPSGGLRRVTVTPVAVETQ